MNLIFNSTTVRLLWWIFAPVLTALILISLIKTFMIDYYYSSSKEKPYLTEKSIRYHFPSFFPHAKEEKREKAKKIDTFSEKAFKNLVLKACYVEKNNTFIMFEDEKKKMHILSVNESYKGAKLVKVEMDKAVFSKNSKDIILTLEKKVKKGEANPKKDTVVADDKYIRLNRKSFKNYIDNPQNALKDVRFRELRNSRQKFMGLSLSFVRKNSFFDKMGLKNGDIIKSIDGKSLNSLMDLLPYYNNINNTTSIELGVVRNGNYKEIIYEID